MKKIAIFFGIIVIAIVAISYKMIEYQKRQEEIKKANEFYEDYLDREITGTALLTIMNKAVDNNEKNSVEKDKNEKYINNENNSINIDIKMLDRNRTLNMEKILKKEMNDFVTYYGDITFKCTKIEYHEKTSKIKYMLFEQITAPK